MTTTLPADQFYFTTRELNSAGVSSNTITRLVRAGTLHRVTPGLYSRHPPRGEHLLRALLHQRPHLVFTGRTAVQLRRALRITTPVTVLVPRNRAFRSTGLVTVIRADHRPHELLDGLPVASVLRAACDAPPDEGVGLLERHYRGREGRRALEADLDTWVTVPARLRERIGRASIGADSETERRLFRALRARGYPFEQNKLLGHYFRDGVHEGCKVVVEVNGYHYHHTISALIKDYWKANDAVARGYRHLSFSDACIDLHLGQVVDFIVAVLEGRSPRVRRMEWWHSAWTQPHALGQ